MSEKDRQNDLASTIIESKKSPKISVIVPVYKVEKYLPECIESVLAQTFTDFELILVDDGSPDNSGKICDDYAQKDSRIRVFHKENGGVSSARNLGLDNARGEWIAFVDSDDWVGEKYLEHLLGGGELSASCMVMSGHVKRDSRTGRLFEPLVFTPQVLSATEAFRNKQLYKSGFPFSKLYCRDILDSKQIRFNPEISMSEDTLFMMDYLTHATCVYFRGDSADYNYRYVRGSLSKRYGRFEREFLLFLEYRTRFENFVGCENSNGEERKQLAGMFFRALFCLYRPPFLERKERLGKLCYARSSLRGNEFSWRDASWLGMIFFQKEGLFDIISVTLFRVRYGVLKPVWCMYVEFANLLRQVLRG